MRPGVLVVLYLCMLGANSLAAQGVYTEYGQNRVQYRSFQWTALKGEKIEILYYGDNESVAGKALEHARLALLQMESYLAYKHGSTVQIMLFQSLNDYRQSNVGYTNPQWNSGGFTVIPNDMVTVYFTGDYQDLQYQIKRAVCDVMLREMIYGGTLQDRFERVKSPLLPRWFTQGLCQFLATGWDAAAENRMRDAMSVHGFKNLQLLDEEETDLAGQSIWRYIVEEFGTESIATIVFIARYSNSAEEAVRFHTKKTLHELLSDWREHNRQLYSNEVGLTLPRGKANVPKRLSTRPNTRMSISPDGSQIAIITNEKGRFTLWVYQPATSKTKALYHGGIRVPNQVPEYRFPILQWKPDGKQLDLLTYEQGKYVLCELNTGGKIQRRILFPGFSSIVDFSYSSRGDELLLSAVSKGQCDIYRYQTATGAYTSLTQDAAFDQWATYLPNGRDILFISDRRNGKTQDLFLWQEDSIIALTHNPDHVHLSSPIAYSDSIFAFLSDQSGLRNAWLTTRNAAGKVFGQTDYRRSILQQSISVQGNTLAELLLVNGHYTIFTSQLSANPLEETVTVSRLSWRNRWNHPDSVFGRVNAVQGTKAWQQADSSHLLPADTIQADFTFQTGFPKVDFTPALVSTDSGAATQAVFRGRFVNTVQPELILSQSDNRILGSYLFDRDVPREIMRNPLIMPYIRVTLADLEKNYQVEAGVRSSLDLLYTDYHASYAIYRHRIDHHWQLWRRSRKYEAGTGQTWQNLATAARYSVSLPLDERFKLTATPGLRTEFLTIKASESGVLQIPDVRRWYGTSSFEALFDNTRSLGMNMYRGFRGKASVELMKNPAESGWMNYLMADLRQYVPLKPRLIWATRITGAYSLSSHKAAWYLGAVENWTQRTQYLRGTPVLKAGEYLFSGQVANLRGFYRGVRMGSSYMLVNTELRCLPVLMLRRRPLENEFLRQLMVTAFADAGTAFTGRNPADPENPFNTQYISSPNYDLSITSRRNPWVFGIGFGVRSRLLGYYVRYDRAWGYMENRWQNPLDYFALGLDF
ncbi:MAG: PD40 domain-containing protein [Bacteroidetes bacterium]|nr:PD40 domain-containing protein [Bacteroidota bacterium]